MPHLHKFYDFVVSVFVVYPFKRNNRSFISSRSNKNDYKVLLVYHKKYQEWLPIGGHIELDEDPEEALYREIEEECGLKVTILAETVYDIKHPHVKPIPTPSFVDVHAISDDHKHIAFIYFGVAKTSRVKLHVREHKEYRWVGKAELLSPELKLTKSIYFYCIEALKAAERFQSKKRK